MWRAFTGPLVVFAFSCRTIPLVTLWMESVQAVVPPRPVIEKEGQAAKPQKARYCGAT